MVSGCRFHVWGFGFAPLGVGASRVLMAVIQAPGLGFTIEDLEFTCRCRAFGIRKDGANRNLVLASYFKGNCFSKLSFGFSLCNE